MTEPPTHSPSPPTIRPATNADVLEMAGVHISSWLETYPGMLPKPMLEHLSIASEAIRWQRMLDHPGAPDRSVAFVAEQQGSVVGYGSCGEQRTQLLRDDGFTGEIGEIYVLRRAQRQGAGSGLMTAMAAALIDQGHKAMSLWVLEENMVARHFYQRLGGTPIARKRGRLMEVAYGWTDLVRLSEADG